MDKTINGVGKYTNVMCLKPSMEADRLMSPNTERGTHQISHAYIIAMQLNPCWYTAASIIYIYLYVCYVVYNK